MECFRFHEFVLEHHTLFQNWATERLDLTQLCCKCNPQTRLSMVEVPIQTAGRVKRSTAQFLLLLHNLLTSRSNMGLSIVRAPLCDLPLWLLTEINCL